MIEIVLGLLVVIGIGNLVLNLRSKTQVPRSDQNSEVLLDTCALIDGRILELAKTGFTPKTLIVPQFVIAELQGLADGRNSLKRERARQGLDMIQELQANPSVDVEIVRDAVDSQMEVDDKLVQLAKDRNAQLYTTDYNLNKVAEIEGVRVLNVNELSQLLRPVHLPGETAKIKIVQKGNGRGQGVGYLDDGTMVVVNEAAKKVGKTVTVEFERHIQTAAGKMMFAKIKTGKSTN